MSSGTLCYNNINKFKNLLYITKTIENKDLDEEDIKRHYNRGIANRSLSQESLKITLLNQIRRLREIDGAAVDAGPNNNVMKNNVIKRDRYYRELKAIQ